MSNSTSIFDISPEVVAGIEPRLDHSELCSCIFLLYDNIEAALQHIMYEIQTSSRKYLPVLDSCLYKAGDSLGEGPLVQWARFSVGRDDKWPEKLIEAFFIIKNFEVIKSLGGSKRDLELKFLPSQSNTSYRIDLARKVLFLMMDDLTMEDWNKLQNLLTNETNQSIPIQHCKIPECLLLILMSRNILKTKRKDQKMDFRILRSCLKSMDLDYWAYHLKNIEDVINGGSEYQVEEPIAPARFDLDPQNPGTILIFNLESYGKKIVDRSLSKRTGSHIDCERLTDTFNLLGFNVLIHKDPSSDKILKEIATSLKSFCCEAKQSERERCFVVAILAHGEKDGLVDEDGVLLKWDMIRAELRSSDTAGLPRLLIIQACKGDSQVTKFKDKLEVVEDGPASEASLGNLRDLFELSASVSGFAAYRSEVHGSFFIHSFCKNILLFGRKSDLSQLAPLINRDFDNKDLYSRGKNKLKVFMTSELSVTASKSLYLGVRENKEVDARALVQSWDSIEQKPNSQQPQQKQSENKHQSTNSHKENEAKEKGLEMKEGKEEQEKRDEVATAEENRQYFNPTCCNNKQLTASEEKIYNALKQLALSKGNAK